MLIASKGHFFGQIPHPIHNRSEMKAILLAGSTSMHSFPVRTTGHDFLHSCRHFLGLHLSELTMAILRNTVSETCLEVVFRLHACAYRVSLSDMLLELSLMSFQRTIATTRREEKTAGFAGPPRTEAAASKCVSRVSTVVVAVTTNFVESVRGLRVF